MKIALPVLLIFLSIRCPGQDISGYWQGVDYSPSSATTEYWASLLTLQQNGTNITGKLYQYASNKPQYFLEVEVMGTSQNNAFQIKTGKILRENLSPGTYWCLNGQGTFTYNPAEESLKGILTYANCTLKSIFEIYLVKPKTKTKYCKGEKISITVTGQDIRWYDSDRKTQLVGRGNTFEPNITQTTTFYATQTHYNTESPVAPVTIEVGNPKITGIDVQPTTCSLANGSVKISATGDAPLTYSRDAQNFQPGDQFANLTAQSYTLTVRDNNGCLASQTVSVAPSSKPVIADVGTVPTTCGLDNGSITISASGGNGSLLYSYDGANFQTNPVFDKIKPGNYTIEVKDADGCKDTKATTIAPSNSLKIDQLLSKEASCGIEDGSIEVRMSGGQSPYMYSMDSTAFGPDPTFKKLKAGDYRLVITDANKCYVSQSAKVRTNCTSSVYFPTSFSPNNDGTNDTFAIFFSSNSLKINRFSVYNRWGNYVAGFEDSRTAISGEALWNGLANGLPVQQGVYQFIAEVEFDTGEKFVYKNSIAVVK